MLSPTIYCSTACFPAKTVKMPQLQFSKNSPSLNTSLSINNNVTDDKLCGSTNCANCENRQRRSLPQVHSYSSFCTVNLSSRRHFLIAIWSSCPDECTCPECNLYFEACHNSWTPPPAVKKWKIAAKFNHISSSASSSTDIDLVDFSTPLQVPSSVPSSASVCKPQPVITPWAREYIRLGLGRSQWTSQIRDGERRKARQEEEDKLKH